MFEPNPKAVQETCDHMLALRKGGYRDTIEDAMWWAWEHAFSYDRHENGHKFWRAVHARLDEMRKERAIKC